jgi:hypothetical protein
VRDRCWILQDGEDEPHHYPDRPTAALQALADPGDSTDGPTTVQLDHVCFQVECAVCGWALENEETGWTIHFDSEAEAAAYGRDVGWSTDGSTWWCGDCPRPDHADPDALLERRADLARIEAATHPGQLAMGTP